MRLVVGLGLSEFVNLAGARDCSGTNALIRCLKFGSVVAWSLGHKHTVFG